MFKKSETSKIGTPTNTPGEGKRPVSPTPFSGSTTPVKWDHAGARDYNTIRRSMYCPTIR